MGNISEVGFVKSSRGFLVHLEGLPSVEINDMVQSEPSPGETSGVRGWVNALDKDKLEVLLIDNGEVIHGQMFKKLPERLSIPAGDELLGRVVNPLCEPIDGKTLKFGKNMVRMPLEKLAPGISKRKIISEQFDTGVLLVDTLIPLGRGQRELISGDPRSGKTNFLLDAIVNQKKTNVICVYALIGKSVAEVSHLISTLKVNGALDYSVIVVASSADPTPLIYLAPKTAMTIAEYWQSKGKDVLLILDDMGSHAKIYREIALLGGRPPGRESYPGDIFYQHAHLLERAGYFSDGGSITALPVIELDLNDFGTLIPTNIMSMTDGHLLFRSALSNQGQRPAVDISLSVSRVGRQTQGKVQDLLATRIRQILAQATQYETISRFSFELPAETQMVLHNRILLNEALRQPPLTFISKDIQCVFLCLIFTSFFKDKDKDYLRLNREKIMKMFEFDPELKKVLGKISKMETDQELIDELEKLVPRVKELCEETTN